MWSEEIKVNCDVISGADEKWCGVPSPAHRRLYMLWFQFNFNLIYLVNGFIMKEVVKVRAGGIEGKVLKTLENSIKVVQNKG